MSGWKHVLYVLVIVRSEPDGKGRCTIYIHSTIRVPNIMISIRHVYVFMNKSDKKIGVFRMGMVVDLSYLAAILALSGWRVDRMNKTILITIVACPLFV